MPDNPADNGQQRTIELALAVRSAKALEKHLDDVQGVQRMAIENTVRDNEELRNQIVTAQQRTIDGLNDLVEKIQALLAQMATLAVPPKVNVPQTSLTLSQQPVTVNVPKSQVSVNPTIKVPEIKIPEPSVIVQKTERKLPKGAVIKHGDGSQSQVEFY